MLKPIIPFEPILAKSIPTGSSWVAQVKWDGVRILTYYDGFTVSLFNRKLNQRMLQFPELMDIKRLYSAFSVILDGEVIALKNGKPSFFEVMKRDSARKTTNITHIKCLTPIIYMVFDILFYNDKWVLDLPLQDRRKILKKIIIPQEKVQQVENFADGDSLYQAIKEKELEGIVCKDLRSSYIINGKDSRWQKIKNYHDVIATIGGFTVNDQTINALLLGLFDKERKFHYIGHTGSGKIPQREWAILTQKLQALIISDCPYVSKPEKLTNTYWIEPLINAKIKFMEWTPGRLLRHPTLQGLVNNTEELYPFNN